METRLDYQTVLVGADARGRAEDMDAHGKSKKCVSGRHESTDNRFSLVAGHWNGDQDCVRRAHESRLATILTEMGRIRTGRVVGDGFGGRGEEEEEWV